MAGQPEETATLSSIPSSCDCVWSTTEHADGSRSGSIYIASERCQKSLMHPRTFRESNGSYSQEEK